MKGNVKGRILAWVLTIMMVVSYMPQIAFATDTAVTPNTAQTEATHDHDHEATTAAETAESSDASETESSGGTEQESEVETKEPAEDSTAVTEPSEESTKAETKEPVQEEQTRVERAVELAGIVVDGFGLTADMTNDEIADAIQTANVDDATGNAVNELMALAESATRDEYKEAIKYDDVKLFERFYYVLEKMNTPETVASLNEEVISGVTVSTSDADSASASNGVVTIKRSGSTTSGCSSKDETRTTTVTITSTAVGSILSFGWEMTSGSLTINGSAASGSSFSQEITANPTTVKLVYTSPAGKNNTGTLTLKDFSLISDNQTFKVTVQNESSLGSVKAAGNTLTGESTVFDAVSSKDGIELVATPNSGATFLGWIDANPDNKDTYGTILSTAQTYVLKPTHDIIVMPAFAAPTAPAWFGVGSSYLYNDLNKANEKAASTTKVIVPVKDGVLEAGDYTISSGVTLLIPFDANNTLYTDEPGDAGESVTTTSAFRTLTMADGAKITVNGAISVGGRQATGQKFNGLISGAYGHIKMLSGSDIVVKSGGFLYAWGFVSGAGEVEILSGATVYESFQVRDWRGGSFASSFLDNEQKIFPLSQYYVQNVEVPMKIHSGATEYGFTSVAVTLLGTQTSKVPFIGPSGTLFNINEGYIIKDYDEAQDRLVIESHNADVTMDAISLSMQVSIISNLKFNSANYVLPITNNITVNVLEGSSVTITQDIAFLPGSEFYVDETSYCSVKNDKSVFIYDYDQWGGYCSPDDLEYMQLLNVQGGAPKARTLKDASLCVDGTVDASEGYIYVTTKEAGDASEFANIYSTGNGVIICRDGDAECTYQVKQESTSVEAIVAIPVAPAYLKNADGSFASTIVDGTVRTFKYVNGKWHTLHEVPAYDATCLESGSKEGFMATTVAFLCFASNRSRADFVAGPA